MERVLTSSLMNRRAKQQRSVLQPLPCLLQDTRGFGWPSAIHSITAGRPSITVVLRGGATITTLFEFAVSSGRRQSERHLASEALLDVTGEAHVQ